MDATTHHHTDEQLDILNAATMSKDNLMISALAGTGKSTTLLAVERELSKPTPVSILYLVFNTENARKIMSFEQMEKERKKPAVHHSEDPNDRALSTTTV